MEKLSVQELSRKRRRSDQLHDNYCIRWKRKVPTLKINEERRRETLDTTITRNAIVDRDWATIKLAVGDETLFSKIKVILGDVGEEDSLHIFDIMRKTVDISLAKPSRVTMHTPEKDRDDRDDVIKTTRMFSNAAKSQMEESLTRIIEACKGEEKPSDVRDTNMHINFLKKSAAVKEGRDWDLEEYVNTTVDQFLQEFVDWVNETMPPCPITVKFMRDLFAMTYNDVIPDSINSLTVTVEELNAVESSMASHDQDMQRSTGAMLYRQIYRDIKASTSTPHTKALYQDWLHVKRIPQNLITMLGTFHDIEDLASTHQFYNTLRRKGITPPQHLANFYNKNKESTTALMSTTRFQMHRNA